MGKNHGMSDASEITRGVTEAFAQRKLDQALRIVAEWIAEANGSDPPVPDALKARLSSAGCQVPVLYCEGASASGECDLRLHHSGPCRWRPY